MKTTIPRPPLSELDDPAEVEAEEGLVEPVLLPEEDDRDEEDEEEENEDRDDDDENEDRDEEEDDDDRDPE